MAAVLVLTMQQPMGRGSRTATLATTTPNLLPYPGTLRWQAGAREGRVGGGGGDSGLRERGPPRPYRTRVGVAHPLGAGRRPFGGNPKGVSEPRRLAARHVSFTGSKAAEASQEWVSMTSLLKFLVCIDCPRLSLY